ncbi:MAG: hypothetical protein LKG20_04985 [Tetrasphaera jenkinsii]|jgi:hypothetical protein|uniref:Uncharacterized protein n=2 Tax=Nostocoides jenkinsii TaxID=330834 RepID=A0A077M549_9MICO|nr:hypothetical protein [Tetrasphaera jenkinsii]CCI51704.1 conserved hypothetical protein [Tetrasphaera jenkinsii Ben 74]
MSLDLGMTTGPAGGAPRAPGRLGVPVGAAEALRYLTDLGLWIDDRRKQLDAIDAAALNAPNQTDRDALTHDMTVSMALWKAIHDRYELLKVTFDSGRVGAVQAEQLSTLIWGRLDVTPGVGRDAERARVPSAAEGALAVSLPEACRLSDAMTSSLRARLALEPSGLDIGIRVKAIREGIERLRDQIALTPPGAARDKNSADLIGFQQRLFDVTERAKRGGDVGGYLGPLEIDVAGRERDLIVAASRRHESERDAATARTLITELAARGDAIRAMQTQCLASLNPAPKLAVPDVRALGAVPDDPDAVDALLARLQLVSRALDQAHETYARALGERDQLLGLMGALDAQAAASPEIDAQERADLAPLRAQLADALASTPIPLVRARALMAAYQSYLQAVTRKGL